MKILSFLLLFGLIACASWAQKEQPNNEAFYQMQIIPAGGSRALFFNFTLDKYFNNQQLIEVVINAENVPFTHLEENSTVEVYLLENSGSEAEGQSQISLYKHLFLAETYKATLIFTSDSVHFTRIIKKPNQTLPQ